MARLADKVAIITGAGQGIGLAYAQRFLDEGAKVVVAEINEDRAQAGMAALAGRGDAVFVPTDAGDYVVLLVRAAADDPWRAERITLAAPATPSPSAAGP